MLLLGFPLGFCAAGIPASMGALFNELYPAGVRGTGVGFCYNFGRILAAGLPVLIGAMSGSMSLGTAIGINAAVAYSLVLVVLLLLPETQGRVLDVRSAGWNCNPGEGLSHVTAPALRGAALTRHEINAGVSGAGRRGDHGHRHPCTRVQTRSGAGW